MLPPGLYEQVINTALNRELSKIPEARKSVAPIDKAEASQVLAQYLADVVQKGLENVVDNGGDISMQIGLANKIVDLIQNTTQEAAFAALNVDQRAEQLLALLREQDPRLAVGKTAADLSRPETSVARTSLFTGAPNEPQMVTELKKEIASADHIDLLVSFIKWSGLRMIVEELREFAQNGGQLRVITTSYMGATDIKAVNELYRLPNTKIKVSYNTKITRLHAKAYIFSRNSGFTTAYVGSSNISNVALTKGLEWNTKVTKRDLPETIEKICATFEYYWNDREFEYYSEDQQERLARALKAEKYFDTNNTEVYTMDIAPYSYQQEILDKLEAERTVRDYQKWWELQCKVNDFYSEREQQRPPLSEQKEFRAIKNAVIQEADHVRLNHISFEDRDMEDYGDWVDERSLTWTCRELWRIVENEGFPLEDRDEAAERLELLAKMGDPYAQTFLGQLYRDGGLLIPDAEKARYWLEQAAERELPQAQYVLGKLLLSDDPDVHDPGEGIRWLNVAAQNGNDYAAYALGKEYLRGEHVLKNAGRAAEYFRQAAEAQNPWAQYLLGKLYLMGEGVGQDQDIAYGWFQTAAIQGHTYAQFFKERMEQSPPGPPSLMLSATQLLHHMGNIFRDNVPEDSTSTGMHIDHKRLQALQEKRIALGHRPDDHVEEQNMGGMTMGGM